MGQNRAFGEVGGSSPDDIRRAGGSDPRRYDAKIIHDHSVTNHDRPGYNPDYQHNDPYVAQVEAKAMSMGTPNPDGTYSK